MESKQPKNRQKVKIIPAVLGLPVVLVLAGVLLFFLTWTDPQAGLPQGKLAFRASSLHRLLEDAATLEAGEVTLAAAGLSSFKGTLLAWLTSDTAQSFVAGFFSQEPVHGVVLGEGNFLVVSDLGWKSLFSRFFPGFMGNDITEGFTKKEDSGVTFFQWTAPQGGALFLIFDRNLLALCSSQEALLTWARRDTLPEASPSPKDPQGENFSFTASYPELLKEMKASPAALGFLNAVGKNKTTVQLDLEDRRINALLPVSLKEDFQVSQEPQEIWDILPQDTVFALSVSLSLNSLVPLLWPEVKDFPVWTWAGEETGLLYQGGNPDPVFFVRIGDPSLWEKAETSLSGEQPATLALPPAVSELLRFLDYSGNSTTYLEAGGFLFITGGGSGLKESAFQKGKGLVQVREFALLAGKQGLRGPLNAYADLDRKIPFYLESENLLFRLLRLYGRNMLSLTSEDSRTYLTFQGLKGRSRLVRTFTGYPRLIPQEAASSPLVLKSALPGKVLVGSLLRGPLVFLQDPLKDQETTWNLPEGSTAVPEPLGSGLYLWDNQGNLDFRGADGISLPGYPRLLPGAGNVQGLPTPGGVLISLGKQLEYHQHSAPAPAWSRTLPAPVQQLSDTRLGHTILVLEASGAPAALLDSQGYLLKGWPKAPSFTEPFPPLLMKSGAEVLVARMNAQGDLEVRDALGDLLPGFPKAIPGEYQVPPAVLVYQDREHLVLADSRGSLTIVDPTTGDAVVHRQIKEITTDSRLTVRDLDHNGREELLAYGSNGLIWAWNDRLEPLADFPVNGVTEPQFWDLDRDGFLEMISGDGQRRMFVHTLRF